MNRSPIVLLFAAAWGLGLSGCDKESSPTAPSTKEAAVNSRHDAKLVGSWYSTSTFENETMELRADSSARLVVDWLDSGKVLHDVFLGTWFTEAGKVLINLKSGTRSENGKAAYELALGTKTVGGAYQAAGDSLVMTVEGSRDVYRKGTAPAFVAPSLKAQVVGSWKALEVPYEATMEILAGGSYKQVSKYPTATGGSKWSMVEGTWAVAGNTLVLTQVKFSDSNDGKSWTAATDFLALVEEWPVTIPDSEHMDLKGDDGIFGYLRL